MSDPKEQKNLWKNCTWKDAEEKLAFFNHYFKESSMVTDRIDNQVTQERDSLLRTIEDGMDNKTPMTVANVVSILKE